MLKIMNKSVLGVLAVAIIILLGGFFLSKNNQSPATTTSTDSAESSVVIYSNSGYSPANLIVKVGDTVNFKNQSGKSMWVASAPHPTHTDYPEFDAKKGVAMGESYMFTFTKTGTWRYHDHLNPTSFGAIVVE